jgi:hypothetical protein
MAAMAWISCWPSSATAQAAQRVAMVGTVWPRCWVSPAKPDPTNRTPNEQVRCNSQRLNVLISADHGQFQLCAEHRQTASSGCDLISGEARRVTVTPRS